MRETRDAGGPGAAGGEFPLPPPLPRTVEELEHLLAARPSRRAIEGDEWERAAVAVVVRPVARPPGPELEVLMIRRADHPQDPWSGHLAFPGGRRDPGDRDLEHTAIRETLEEVGLDLRGARRLGVLDELVAYSGRPDPRLVVTPWAFAWTGEDPALSLSPEVAEVMWVRLSHLAEPRHRIEHVLERDGQTLRFPGIAIGRRVLWGLTLRMVEDLFEALRSSSGAGPESR